MKFSADLVRKKWLRSWKALFGYQAVISILSFIFALVSRWQGDSSGEEFLVGFLLGLWSMMWLSLCRKCAYDKPGTKLLTTILIFSIGGYARHMSEASKIDCDIYDILNLIIYSIVFIWFVVHSIKLRSLNKATQSVQNISSKHALKNKAIWSFYEERDELMNLPPQNKK